MQYSSISTPNALYDALKKWNLADQLPQNNKEYEFFSRYSGRIKKAYDEIFSQNNIDLKFTDYNDYSLNSTAATRKDYINYFINNKKSYTHNIYRAIMGNFLLFEKFIVMQKEHLLTKKLIADILEENIVELNLKTKDFDLLKEIANIGVKEIKEGYGVPTYDEIIFSDQQELSNTTLKYQTLLSKIKKNVLKTRPKYFNELNESVQNINLITSEIIKLFQESK